MIAKVCIRTTKSGRGTQSTPRFAVPCWWSRGNSNRRSHPTNACYLVIAGAHRHPLSQPTCQSTDRCVTAGTGAASTRVRISANFSQVAQSVRTALKSFGQFILERRTMLGLRGRELVVLKALVGRFRFSVWWTSNPTATSHWNECSNSSQQRSRRVPTFFTTSFTTGRIPARPYVVRRK